MTFISYAQNFEDVMLWRALKHVQQGFWIDVGAAHPDEYSVTRAFSDRGWRGINIEANPPYVARIAGARPRDVTLGVAAGADTGSTRFFEVIGTGMSSMDRGIADQHRLAGFEVREHEVPLRTLASICTEHAPADIHFLKIDVEGAERDVLTGADFTNYRPWIVLVEATKPNSQEQNHAAWEPLLFAANYRFAWFDGLNRFYIAAEFWDELAPAFATPPNVFDDFVRATDAEHLQRIVGAEQRAGQAEQRAGQAAAHTAQADMRVAKAEARAEQAVAKADTRAAEAEARAGQAVAKADTRAAEAETRAKKAVERAEARAAEAEARTARADVRVAKAEARAEQAEERAAAHAGEMKARLAQLHASTSWRVTGPIRAVRELFRGRAGLALQEMGMAQPTVQRLKTKVGKAKRAHGKAGRVALNLATRAASRVVGTAAAERGLAAIAPGFASRSVGERRRVGWVTTWNVKCGIAAAAAHLIDGLPQEDVIVYAAHQEPRTRPDAENCRRIWWQGKSVNGLAAILADLEQADVGALIIHFNYGFYNHAELSAFIEEAVARGVVVIMDLHSTVDHSKEDPDFQLAGLISGLRKCHRLLAHSLADMNRLKALGLVDNVTLFPLGIIAGADRPVVTRKNRHGALIASFGFCLPGKGLPELVEAMGILVKKKVSVRLLMLNAQYPASVSEDEAEKVRRTIRRLKLDDLIDFRTDYLPDEECLLLLQEADLIVNSYQATGEGASAAARFGLASGSPVLVTPIPIFDDLGDAVFRMPGVSPADIAKGIVETLHHLEQDTPQSGSVRAAAVQWRNAHDFRHQGAKLMAMIKALGRDLGREHA